MAKTILKKTGIFIAVLTALLAFELFIGFYTMGVAFSHILAIFLYFSFMPILLFLCNKIFPRNISNIGKTMTALFVFFLCVSIGINLNNALGTKDFVMRMWNYFNHLFWKIFYDPISNFCLMAFHSDTGDFIAFCATPLLAIESFLFTDGNFIVIFTAIGAFMCGLMLPPFFHKHKMAAGSIVAVCTLLAFWGAAHNRLWCIVNKPDTYVKSIYKMGFDYKVLVVLQFFIIAPAWSFLWGYLGAFLFGKFSKACTMKRRLSKETSP